MAKELPYFQFEPAEYITGDISFCSLETQGLFINLCSYYWQRSCNLTKDQFLRRINNEKCFNELVTENVIILENNTIKIGFLDEQFSKATNLSNVNKINGSKGGRPPKINPIKSELKPNQKPIESEKKGIREEKIKEDNIIINDDVLIPIYDLYLKYINNEKLLSAFCKGQSTTKDVVIKKLKEFNNNLEETDVKIKTWNNYTSHFRNWFKKNLEKQTDVIKIINKIPIG